MSAPWSTQGGTPDHPAGPVEESGASGAPGRVRAPLSWRVLLWPALLVLVGAACGALLGALWFWLWTPTDGLVLKDTWLMPGDTQRAQFDGTGWFVVVGGVGGLLLGLLAAGLGGRRPIGTLVGVILGSLVATRVMFLVGNALGPADPRPLAKGAKDWTAIPSELRVGDQGHLSWWDPDLIPNAGFVVLPAFALLGLVTVFLAFLPRSSERD